MAQGVERSSMTYSIDTDGIGEQEDTEKGEGSSLFAKLS
jgi:hypothetical protein